MSVFSGPEIETNGLILSLDASNSKSTRGSRSLINWESWTVGSGSVAGYSQNGSTDENQRLLDTNPWGITDVVWGSYPNGTAQDDGGWNGAFFSIDRTKLYRFSTWVRRTSTTTGGTFYLGTNADGEGVRRTDNGAVQGNPYWDCRNISWMTQNQWYLVTGHIYPADTTFTGRHPESGVYTVSGGRFGDIGGCNIGNDLKWGTNCTAAMHRSYHYYCPDNTSRLQWYQPRVDLCDGTEPSIAELLANAGSTWYDLSGTSSNMVGQSNVTLASVNNVTCYNFNATGKKFTGSLFGTQPTTNLTYEAWIYPDASELQADDRGCIMLITGNQPAYLSWNKSSRQMSNYWYGHPNEGYHESGASVNRNSWSHFCCVWDFNAGVAYQWTNGVRTTSSATQGNAATGSILQIGQEGSSRQFSGKIALLRIYNTALTDTQVLNNFNSVKSKFGF